MRFLRHRLPRLPFPFHVWAIASGGRQSRVDGGQPASRPRQTGGSRSPRTLHDRHAGPGAGGQRRGALARGRLPLFTRVGAPEAAACPRVPPSRGRTPDGDGSRDRAMSAAEDCSGLRGRPRLGGAPTRIEAAPRLRARSAPRPPAREQNADITRGWVSGILPGSAKPNDGGPAAQADRPEGGPGDYKEPKDWRGGGANDPRTRRRK